MEVTESASDAECIIGETSPSHQLRVVKVLKVRSQVSCMATNALSSAQTLIHVDLYLFFILSRR